MKERFERIRRRNAILIKKPNPVVFFSTYDHNTSGPKPEIVAALGATYHCEPVEDLAKLNADIVIECTGVPSVIATLLPHIARRQPDVPDRHRCAVSQRL